MSIVTEQQLRALREVGRIVRLALEAMRARLAPGVSTAELDRAAAEVLAANGAGAAPQRIYNFPGSACISVNEEIVHGIPGERVVLPGDLVKLDVTAEKGGFVADAAITVAVPPVDPEAERLIACVEAAFGRAIDVVRAGNCVSDIGRAVEDEVRSRGFSIVRELTGHGIGRAIHEKPPVPNYFDRRFRQRLTEGLVLAVEPIIAAGNGRSIGSPDGWTVLTADGSLAAHFEQTLVVSSGEPILLTAA
jgi:methionyl aminopeptidase